MINLTQRGQRYVEVGLPELRFWEMLESGPRPIRDFQNRHDMTTPESGQAFGFLKRQNIIRISQGIVSLVNGASRADLDARQELLYRIGSSNISLEALSERERNWIACRPFSYCFA